jgi:hypothetical protein
MDGLKIFDRLQLRRTRISATVSFSNPQPSRTLLQIRVLPYDAWTTSQWRQFATQALLTS